MEDFTEINNLDTARPKQTQTGKCRDVGDAIWFHSNRLPTCGGGGAQWQTGDVHCPVSYLESTTFQKRVIIPFSSAVVMNGADLLPWALGRTILWTS